MNHFFSKLPSKVGLFLLSSLLLVGMLIVFGTGLYLSWGHTYELSNSQGMTDSQATAYTLFGEVILAISEVVVIFKALMKKKIHWSVYLGMAFGFSITATSNILYLGFLMGISIPVGTAIASLIFASALLETTSSKKEEKPAEKTDTITSPIETMTPVKEPHVPPIEIPAMEIEKIEPLPVEKTEQKEKTTANRKPKSTKRKPPKKKATKPKKTAAEDVDYNAIIEVAKRLQAEHEKVGRDRLAKEAGTTPHYARIALLKLEELAAENSASNQEEKTEQKPVLALAK